MAYSGIFCSLNHWTALSAAHGVQDEFAVVRHELLEYGNRTCVHPHMRIGVCHDGSVEIDRYDCSFNGHIGYFF